MTPILACSFAIWNAAPVISKQIAMHGNVVSNSLRRPKVSMVYTAGRAKTKLTMPKPQDPSRAEMVLNPPCWKIVDE